MNSQALSRFLFLNLVCILLLFRSSKGANYPDQYYKECGNSFSCGSSAIGIGYPFRGSKDPSFCGHPDLVLSCEEEGYANVTTIVIMNVKFRVLGIDPFLQTMRIARDDVIVGTCPDETFNTTLDVSLFDYISTYENITFLYSCPDTPPNSFPVTCTKTGYGSDHPVYMAIGNRGPGKCDNSVTVPVPYTSNIGSGKSFDQAELDRDLQQGLEIRWKVDSQPCNDCKQSKGRCGFDLAKNQTTCFCPNAPYVNSTCLMNSGASPEEAPYPGGNGKKNNKVALPIGLGIGGAVLAGLVLGWLFFYCRQRRKLRHLPLAAQTPGVLTKEIKSASSGTPLSTASSNFTQSIPSYPSSKSDIGRGSSYFGAKVFEYEELEQATDNFNPSRELGEGGFGTVYHGELPDGTAIAVKRLYENNFRRVEQFMNEVKILTQVRHPNLVILYGCTSRRSRELLLVYEYVPNGTVADHIHGKRSNSGLLSWPVRLNIAIETAEALSYLHKSDIVHRDVKTNNILLCDKFHVKVADFGLSRLFPTDVTHVSTAPQGTPGYVDPEYYQIYQLTEQSDVYSFGVVLMELISSLLAVDINRHRHDINLSTMAINKIQNHALHEMVDPNLGFDTDSTVRRMITQVAELAFRCLQQEREMRPSMDQVLQTLKEIQSDNTNGDHQEEMVDVLVDDDTGPLKGSDAPSP